MANDELNAIEVALINRLAGKAVTDGPYKGEYISECNSASKTMEIPDVQFTADEAHRIRERFDFADNEFHLKKSARQLGTYCFNYENPSKNNLFYKKFSRELVDESLGEVWFRRYVPFVEESRYDKVKDAIKPFAPAAVSFFDHLDSGFPTGLGFALGAVPLAGAAWLFKKSVIPGLKKTFPWIGRHLCGEDGCRPPPTPPTSSGGGGSSSSSNKEAVSERSTEIARGYAEPDIAGDVVIVAGGTAIFYFLMRILPSIGGAGAVGRGAAELFQKIFVGGWEIAPAMI